MAPKYRRSILFGLTLWVLAVALSLGAQRLLVPGRRVEEGALLYGVAAALAVIGVAAIDRHAPPKDRSPDVPNSLFARADEPTLPPEKGWRERRYFPAAAGLSVPGVGTVVLATYLVVTSQAPDRANWLWVIGLGLLTLAAWLLGTPRLSRPKLERHVWVELLAVLAIVALALALRLPNLVEVPPFVHGDEAAVGLEARRLLSGQVRSLFGVGWYNLPTLSFAPSALAMWIFGDGLFGLRLASVAQGVLSIPLAYLVVRRLSSPFVAVLAAFLLAVSQLGIHYSRVGIIYVQAELASLLLFYLLLKAVDERRPVYYLLAGFAAGLCLEVYFAARIAPLLAGLYLLHRFAVERGFLARQWRGILAVAFGALVFIAPFGVVYTRAPAAFISRAQAVFVLSPESLKHEYFAYKVDTPAEVLRIQVTNTLLAFNLRGETSLQYGRRAPLLDFWTSCLFVLGLAVATLRPRRTDYFFVSAWLWLTLIAGSVLTVDALFSPHIVGAIPVLFVFVALVVDAGRRGVEAAFGRAGRIGFAVLTIAFALLSLRDNYHEYFEVHPRQQPADFFTSLAWYVRSENDDYRIYLLGKPATSLRYDTVRFLVPEVDGVDVRDQPLKLPLEQVPESKGVGFVVEAAGPDPGPRLDAIRRAYPEGRLEAHTSATGVPLFTSYLVEPSALRAALGRDPR